MKDIDAVRHELGELAKEFGANGGSADAAYGALREAILSRLLLPGHHFAEEDFAKAFNVSRTPVREAVLRLQAEGLVERMSRRGVVVSVISPAEVLEIYEVRIVLDGLAAQLAASNCTPPEIAQLKWINERMRSAGEQGDYEEMGRLNLEFHGFMAQTSRNSFLVRQIGEVQDRVRRFADTTFGHPGRWKVALEEHDEIIAALEAHDEEQAREAACRHMGNAKQVRLAMVEEGAESSSEGA